MRKLNNRQRIFLDDMYEQGITCVEDMTSLQWKLLEEMNDHETLYQNSNRYLMDKLLEDTYG